jgi:hypothetical protein
MEWKCYSLTDSVQKAKPRNLDSLDLSLDKLLLLNIFVYRQLIW